MSVEFDSIVIGSGFGGSVMACRLAEKGDRVLVLERGRRWTPEEMPRERGDAWLYDPRKPERKNGWLDLRFFDDMVVAQGAAVGGGSQIYANVSVRAPENAFLEGWPAEITYDELQPFYDEVGTMLELEELPDNQLTRRFHKMRQGAEALGVPSALARSSWRSSSTASGTTASTTPTTSNARSRWRTPRG